MKQRYESYKPSGIDWIGEIPSHWETCKLKYQIGITSGDYISKDVITDDDTIPVFGGGEQIGYTSKYNVNEKSIIIGRVGARCGCITPIEKGKAWATDNSLICKPLNNFKYMVYFLQCANLNKLNESNAQPLITSTKIKNVMHCLPPLAEQEAIAAWLDAKCGEIDAAVAKVDREIELIDELKQSEISRVVTRGLNPDAPLRPSGIDWIGDIPEHWAINKVKYYSKIFSGEPLSNANQEEFSDIPVYGGGDILGYSKITNAPANTIILGRVGGDGNVRLIKVPFWATDNALIIETSMIKTYLSSALNCAKLLRLNTSTAQPLLTATKIKNVFIPVPPLSEQREIADYLDKKCAEIDGLKEKLKRKRETLVELRQSLISEVVTGKRRVATCRDRINPPTKTTQINPNGNSSS